MALVVHDQIDLDGKMYRRGDVLFGEDADRVALNPNQYRHCTPVPDDSFLHLKKKATSDGMILDMAVAKPEISVTPGGGDKQTK